MINRRISVVDEKQWYIPLLLVHPAFYLSMSLIHHHRSANFFRVALALFVSILPMFTPVVSASFRAGRGHDTKVFMASAIFVGAGFGLEKDTAGGPDVPLSAAETQYICSMQKSLSADTESSLVEWLGHTMAEISGRETKLIMPALKDPAFCASRPLTASVRRAEMIVHLNAKNIVVSTNPVWNACVSGTPLSVALIRSNRDTFAHRQGSTRKTFAKTCRDYHRGDQHLWQHPDFPNLEVQLDAKGRLLGGVPTGFIIKKDVKKTVATR